MRVFYFYLVVVISLRFCIGLFCLFVCKAESLSLMLRELREVGWLVQKDHLDKKRDP